MIEFKCATCGEVHTEGLSPGWDYPVYYLDVPEGERERRCTLTSDTCVIDDEYFFIRGCLEIPVIGEAQPFVWGIWTSLSESNFRRFEGCYEKAHRSCEEPMFGWLSASIPNYPETMNLKTMAHLRDDGVRPFIELEPTDHPLAVEQREGITRERLATIADQLFHR